jgi:hypothetical protein
MAIIYAYHKIHEHGEFNGEWYKTKKTNPKIGDTIYILSGNKTDSRNNYYLEGKYSIRKIDDGKKNDTNIIFLKPISVSSDHILLNVEPDFDGDKFRNQFASGGSCSKVPEDFILFFDKLLNIKSISTIKNRFESGFSEILSDDISDTEKDRLIKSRIGQGDFKDNVISMWGNGYSCALTCVTIQGMLIASHIKAWKSCETKEERLDGANGLLLCAHIDALFDRHLVTFVKKKRDYVLEINKNLDNNSLKGLGIVSGEALCTSRFYANDNSGFERFEQYILHHNKIFYQLQDL